MAKTDPAVLSALIETQKALADAQRELAEAVNRLAVEQAELVRVQSAQLIQQTVTNTIVRAQTTKDPHEREALMAEARALMGSRRAARHRRDAVSNA